MREDGVNGRYGALSADDIGMRSKTSTVVSSWVDTGFDTSLGCLQWPRSWSEQGPKLLLAATACTKRVSTMNMDRLMK